MRRPKQATAPTRELPQTEEHRPGATASDAASAAWRPAGPEAHSGLTSSFHDVFGNTAMELALGGDIGGPGPLIEAAMTLGAAGIGVGHDSLMSNSQVGAMLGQAGPGADPFAGVVARHGQGETFDHDAPLRLDRAAKRGGRALPGGLRAALEAAFGGVDFSGVRVHTDSTAHEAAETIRARAYTVGQDIFFRRGEWSPDSGQGQHLLAHELTHVVQHQEGRLHSSGQDLDVSSPTDTVELEAERMAPQVVEALGAMDWGLSPGPELGAADVGLDAPAPAEGPALRQVDGDSCEIPGEFDHLLVQPEDGQTYEEAAHEASVAECETIDKPKLEALQERRKILERLAKGLSKYNQEKAEALVQGFLTGSVNAVVFVFGAFIVVEGAAGIAVVYATGLAADGVKELIDRGLSDGEGGGTNAGIKAVGDHTVGLFEAGFEDAAKNAPTDKVAKGGSKLLKNIGLASDAVDTVQDATDAMGEYELADAKGEAYLRRNKDKLKILDGSTAKTSLRTELTRINGVLVNLAQGMAQDSGKAVADADLCGDDLETFQKHFDPDKYEKQFGDPTENRAEKRPHGRKKKGGRRPKGGGATLPASLQKRLEPMLGKGSGQVRVHTGRDAADYAESLGAHAVTVGTDIFFNQGEFDPTSAQGLELLAHELHHAVFGGGDKGVSQPGDPHERAAASFAESLVTGGLLDAIDGLLSEGVGAEDGGLTGESLGDPRKALTAMGSALPGAIADRVSRRLGLSGGPEAGRGPDSLISAKGTRGPARSEDPAAEEATEEEEVEPSESDLAMLEAGESSVSQMAGATEADLGNEDVEQVEELPDEEKQAAEQAAEGVTEGEMCVAPGPGIGEPGPQMTVPGLEISAPMQGYLQENGPQSVDSVDACQSLLDMAWGLDSVAGQNLEGFTENQGEQQESQAAAGLHDLLTGGVQERGDSALANTIEVCDQVRKIAAAVSGFCSKLGMVTGLLSLLKYVPIPPLPAVGLALTAATKVLQTVGLVASGVALGASVATTVLSAIQLVLAVKSGAPEALDLYANYQADVGNLLAAGVDFAVQAWGARQRARGASNLQKTEDSINSLRGAANATNGNAARGQLFQGLRSAKPFTPANLLSTKGSTVANLTSQLTMVRNFRVANEFFRGGRGMYQLVTGKFNDLNLLQEIAADTAKETRESQVQHPEPPSIQPMDHHVVPACVWPVPLVAPTQSEPLPIPSFSPDQLSQIQGRLDQLAQAQAHVRGVRDEADSAVAGGQELLLAAQAHDDQAASLEAELAGHQAGLEQFKADALEGQAQAQAGLDEMGKQKAEAEGAKSSAEGEQAKAAGHVVPEPEGGGGFFGRMKRWFQEKVLAKVRDGIAWFQQLIADIVLEIVAQCCGIDDIDAQLAELQGSMETAEGQVDQAQAANQAVMQQAQEMRAQAQEARAAGQAAVDQGTSESEQATQLDGEIDTTRNDLMSQGTEATESMRAFAGEHEEQIVGPGPEAVVDPGTISVCLGLVDKAISDVDALETQVRSYVDQVGESCPLDQELATFCGDLDQIRGGLATCRADVQALSGTPAAEGNQALSEIGGVVNQSIDAANARSEGFAASTRRLVTEVKELFTSGKIRYSTDPSMEPMGHGEVLEGEDEAPDADRNSRRLVAPNLYSTYGFGDNQRGQEWGTMPLGQNQTNVGTLGSTTLPAGSPLSIQTASDGRRYITVTDENGKKKTIFGARDESDEDMKARAERLAPQGEQKSLRERTASYLKDNTSLFKRSASAELWDESVIDESYKDQEFLGGTASGQTKVLSTEGDAAAFASVGPNGVSAGANVTANVTLINMDHRVEWNTGEFGILGEQVSGRFYLFVSGMIGAEARAAIDANIKKAESKGGSDVNPTDLVAGTPLQVDPVKGTIEGPKAETTDGGSSSTGGASSTDTGTDTGATAAVSASAGVFAGAKLRLGAGLAADWHRKEEGDYASQLQSSASTIVDLVSMGNPAISWVMHQVGADTVAEKLLGMLFSWGGAATIPLVGIEGIVEGSAGAGAQIQAKLAFSGGKLEFTWGANVTWGVGLGAQVNVTFDAVEGLKFGLIVMGELAEHVKAWAMEKLSDLGSFGADLLDSIFSWFSADDKVREAVANKAHEIASPAQRAEMIDTLIGGWCGNDDENAVLEILRFSRSNGDLSAVLSAGPDRDDILWALDGAQDDEARSILG